MNTSETKIEKTEWMPIESAPKDGSSILVTDGTRVGESYWSQADYGFIDFDDYSVSDDFRVEFYPWNPAPTHWQPLPQPPEHPKTLQFVQNVRNLIGEQTGLKNDL